MSNDEILTVKETAALLKTTRQQVRKMIANEELPAFWSVGCLTHKSESFRLQFAVLPPFARRIFHCFRPALPAFFGFWVKSGSESLRKFFSMQEYYLPVYPIQREYQSHRKREHSSFGCH